MYGVVFLISAPDLMSYSQKFKTFQRYSLCLPRFGTGKFALVYEPSMLSYTLNDIIEPQIMEIRNLFAPLKEFVKVTNATIGSIEGQDSVADAILRVSSQLEEKAMFLESVALRIDTLARIVEEFTNEFQVSALIIDEAKTVDDLKNRMLQSANAPRFQLVGGMVVLVGADGFPLLNQLI